MPTICVACELPMMLALDDGEYAQARGGSLFWQELEPLSSQESATRVWQFFHSDAPTPERVEAEKAKHARSLIVQVNRLVRWYRVISGDRAAAEVTLWKAGRFAFSCEPTTDPRASLWTSPLEFSPPPLVQSSFAKYAARFTVLAERIREEFQRGGEPPVDQLFLVDARQALDEGRFREAVLFSWSTIDATFTSRFDALVDTALAEEWPESRDFVKGLDFGLRHRMTIGMRLVGRKSFFSESDQLWQRLSTSYKRRNAIIHRGETASEDDAEQAVGVAETVVRLMTSPAIP